MQPNPVFSSTERMAMLSLPIAFSSAIGVLVVLENNNEHLKQLSAEGRPLFRALLSPRQEVGFGACLWAGPGEPRSAAVQSVRPFAWSGLGRYAPAARH